METKQCVHCKEDINKMATKCPKCGGKNYVWTTSKKILLVLILLLFAPTFIAMISSDSNKKETIPPVIKTQKEIEVWNNSPAGRLCEKNPDWGEEDCKNLINEKIWIGMKYEMLVYLMGKPSSVNPSNYGRVTEYQYCWDNRTPSCFYDRNGDDVIDSYN